MAPANIFSLIISGLAWSARGRGLRLIIDVVVGVMLMRVVSPNYFGLMAMVAVIAGFFDLIKSLGTDLSFVQQNNTPEYEKQSLFWFNLISGIFFCITLLSLTRPIQWFYGTNELLPIVGAYAINLALSSIAIIPVAYWLKEFAHKKLFWLEWGPALAGGLAALLLAYMHWYLEALLVRMVLPSLIITSIALLSYCPSWSGLKFQTLKNHLKFGWPATIDSLVNFFVRNLDDLLIGRTLGSNALGQYNRAYGVLLFPLRNFSYVIARSLLPAMRHWREDTGAFYVLYLKLIRLISDLLTPLLVGAWLFAPCFVSIILGPTWEDVIPLFRIFTLLGIFQSIGTLEGFIFQGLNATRHQLQIGLITKPFLLLAILGGVYIGQNTNSIALAYALASIVSVQVGFSRIAKLLGGRRADLLFALLPPILLSMGLSGALLLIWQGGLPYPTDGLTLAVYSMSFIAAYILLKKILMPARFYEVQGVLNQVIFKNQGGAA